jgi:ribonuclease D
LVARRADEIETAYEKLFQAKVLGCDTETSSLSVRYGKLFSVQFSDGDFSVLIPVSEGVALGRLAAILENPDITKSFTTRNSIWSFCAKTVTKFQMFSTP